MKKLAIALLATALIAPVAAFAAGEELKKEVPAAAAPAAGKAEAKPVELKAGGWVKVDDAGKAWVSKDDGKTWAAAPDGAHELKDGSKVETKGGLVVKK